MSNKNCVFCKIIKNEIPSNKVFENKKFLVFFDIKPVNHGHLLIIPKKHIVWMQEVDPKTISEIFILSHKMMKPLKNSLKCDYVQLSVVGTEVPHFHIHLIPRYYKDPFENFPAKEYIEKEANKIKNKIIKYIK